METLFTKSHIFLFCSAKKDARKTNFFFGSSASCKKGLAYFAAMRRKLKSTFGNASKTREFPIGFLIEERSLQNFALCLAGGPLSLLVTIS